LENSANLNNRFVVIDSSTAKVFQGDTQIAVFEHNGQVTAEEIEHIRTDNYE
jgi:hypothetical protein